jgi:hypothetical protein
MSDDFKIMQVISFTGCAEDAARNALESENWSVLDAVERLIVIPNVTGSKYTPQPPVVNDQLTPEVREKIHQARALADLLTFAPQNDLRGKASHYPEQAAQESQTEPQDS